MFFFCALLHRPILATDCKCACVSSWCCSILFPVVLCLNCVPCHLQTVMQSLLPVGTGQTQKTALLPENKARNRLDSVLPCKPVARRYSYNSSWRNDSVSSRGWCGALQQKNISCFLILDDWCRVKLTTSDPNATSDYINASYMPVGITWCLKNHLVKLVL